MDLERERKEAAAYDEMGDGDDYGYEESKNEDDYDRRKGQRKGRGGYGGDADDGGYFGTQYGKKRGDFDG